MPGMETVTTVIYIMGPMGIVLWPLLAMEIWLVGRDALCRMGLVSSPAGVGVYKLIVEDHKDFGILGTFICLSATLMFADWSKGALSVVQEYNVDIGRAMVSTIIAIVMGLLAKYALRYFHGIEWE